MNHTPGNMTPIAFVNVSVVPMDSERILQGQTVVVQGSQISEMGAVGTITVPESAHCIDGQGKYLMPGLVDMHVHLEYELVSFIANGVTAVRNMWGTEYHLRLREKIKAEKLIAPTVYTTGPVMDGNPPHWPGSVVVETPEQAAQAVAEQKLAGYDFVKIYNNLSLEVYDALVEAAAKYGMPVVGHVPYAVSIKHALDSGLHTVEHLMGYEPFLNTGTEDELADIARATRDAGAWNCVTQVVDHRRPKSSEDMKQELQMPYIKYVPLILKQEWVEDSSQLLQLPQVLKYLSTRPEMVKKGTKALHDAGAGILLGTDTPNPYVVPGLSIHQELQYLVDAGLTPYEAIKAGTHNAAMCLGMLDEFGTISVGLRADLLLVGGNPLVDVGNAAKLAGVMLRGRWLPQHELQSMLDALAVKYSTEENPDGALLCGRWHSRSELDAMAEAQHERKMETFIDGILSSNRIFVTGGKDSPAALSFAMKLMQLDFQVYFEESQMFAFFTQDRRMYVRDAPELAIGEEDLLIAISNLPYFRPEVYKAVSAAKESNASTFLVTNLPQPDFTAVVMGDAWNIFDLTFALPDAVVLHPEPKSDFAEITQIFVDEVVTRIMEKRGYSQPGLDDMVKEDNAERMNNLVSRLANGVLSSDRIFLIGTGNSEPVARSSTVKLVQAGYQAYVVGDETAPAMVEGDALIAVSHLGSDSKTCEIASAAKSSGASVSLLTGRSASSMADISDLVFVLGPKPADFVKAAELFFDNLVDVITEELG